MITDESLHGRAVLTSDGLVIGEIANLMLGEDLRVTALVVKVRKQVAEHLGLERSFRAQTIEVPAQVVQSIGDAILLSVPAAGLRAPAQPQPTAPQVH